MKTLTVVLTLVLLTGCATLKQWQAEAQFDDAIRLCMEITNHERKVQCIRGQLDSVD